MPHESLGYVAITALKTAYLLSGLFYIVFVSIRYKNKKIYFDLGFVLCQILDFDINTLTEEQREEITNKTDAGREFVKELIGE